MSNHRKFEVSFELQIYGETAAEAFERATELIEAEAKRLREAGVGAPMCSEGVFPTGGLSGAPHSNGPNGWRLHYSIDEVKE